MITCLAAMPSMYENVFGVSDATKALHRLEEDNTKHREEDAERTRLEAQATENARLEAEEKEKARLEAAKERKRAREEREELARQQEEYDEKEAARRLAQEEFRAGNR